MSENPDSENESDSSVIIHEKLQAVLTNEVLCYIQNYYINGQNEKLIEVLSGFYLQDELFNAKDMLQSLAASSIDSFLKLSHKKRKVDEAREIVELWARLLENGSDMPIYSAVNLQRIPNDSKSSVDVESITNLLKEIKCDVSQLRSSHALAPPTMLSSTEGKINSSTHYQPQQHLPCDSQLPSDLQLPPSFPHFPPLPNQLASALPQSDNSRAMITGNNASNTNNEARQGQLSSKSWADQMNFIPTEAFTNMQFRPKSTTIRGARPLKECRIKTAPRRHYLFVGRLDLETTEEDLTAHLSERGISDVTCKKLKGASRDGRKYKSAAFMVSYDTKYLQMMHSCDIWPEEATVRDWEFKNSEKTKTSQVESKNTDSSTMAETESTTTGQNRSNTAGKSDSGTLSKRTAIPQASSNSVDSPKGAAGKTSTPRNSTSGATSGSLSNPPNRGQDKGGTKPGKVTK